jgi:GT2 family glycosyltransferase
MKTKYRVLQIVIIDNGSCEEATYQYYAKLACDSRFKFISDGRQFNWGRMNNLGARSADGEVLVLLNNDVQITEEGWLEELVRQVQRPDVGIVGARLLYPNGTIQHGGIVTTARGTGLHVMRRAPASYPGYLNQLRTVREVSAVTGACLAIRKSVFIEVGGIEEDKLRVTCSDVDLCFRVRSSGYRVIWTPYSTLIHRELSSRGPDDNQEAAERARKEEAYLAKRWAAHLMGDQYWSPNIALEEDVPPLFAIPPRRRNQ